MGTFEELKTSDYEIGLSKLVGPIKEVHGYLSKEFGDPVFLMTRIEFTDGTELGCEGEHDSPYLVSYGESTPASYTDEKLSRLYRENPDNEDEDEDGE